MRTARIIFAVYVLFAAGLLDARFVLAGIEVVVATGDASPDGNGQLSIFNAPSINSAGQLAFAAELTETVGGMSDHLAILRRDPTGLVLIARRGATFNDKPVNTFFPTSTYIDADGTVSGVVVLGPPNTFLNFLGSGGPMTAMVQPGSSSPSGNNTLLGITTATFNDAGDAIYHATYFGGNPESGLFQRAADGSVTTRALQFAAAPRGGNIESFGGRTVLNESAQIGAILTVKLDGGAFVGSASRIDGTTVHELAREGDFAVDGFTSITKMSSNISFTAAPVPMINDVGQVAFSAQYSQPAAARLGVFLADDDGATLVAPGILPGGSNSTENIRVLGLSNSGQVGFWAEFFGASDPLSGIYVADVSGPSLVALEDTATPVAGKFFRSFFSGSSTQNDVGQLAFLAELSDSANGPAAGRGIFFYDPDGGLKQIARTGDMLAGSTISNIFFFGTLLTQTLQSPDTSLTGLNSLGQVAFAYSLENGQSGIAVWTDPALPGDYNQNGTVDAADYTVWRNNFGSSTALPNDTSPGVDTDDYDRWKTHFGESSGSGSRAVGSARIAVPESSALVLALAAAGLIHGIRRRAFMKLKLYACVVLNGALLTAAQTSAAPTFTPFLSVDINGYNADGGQSLGPTLAGYQGWEAGQGLFVPAAARWDNSGAAGLTKVFSTSQGNVTATMKGIAPNSTLLSRNRGANVGGLPDMYQDFVAAQMGLDGFGQNYIRLQLSGLIPNQQYEATLLAREPAFEPAASDDPLTSYAAWTDVAALGGVDGPGPWMDANVAPQAVYQPVFVDHDMNPLTPPINTGYKNPIPTLARSQVSGPDSASASDPYFHSASILSTADAGGNVVVYGWSDPNGYGMTSQSATLLNGFRLGLAAIVYEGFDYSPPGADLLGANGGNAFSGPWGSPSATANYDVGAGSLSFPRLATSGNRVTSAALTSGIGSIIRPLSTPLGEPGTTQYFSFLVRPEGVLNEGQFNGFFGLRLETAGATDLFVGKAGGGVLDQFVLENVGGTLQHASGTTVEVGDEYLLVLRADFTAANDVFTLYVDPTPGAAEPLSGTVKSDVNIGTIDKLIIYSTGAFSIDEIRIGPTFADVVPLVPLPGDYNLNGTVDAADYTVWRDNLGSLTALPNDDTAGVDQDDYTRWKTHFGDSSGSGALANSAVPEPAAWWLATVALPMAISLPRGAIARSLLRAPAIGGWKKIVVVFGHAMS